MNNVDPIASQACQSSSESSSSSSCPNVSKEKILSTKEAGVELEIISAEFILSLMDGDGKTPKKPERAESLMQEIEQLKNGQSPAYASKHQPVSRMELIEKLCSLVCDFTVPQDREHVAGIWIAKARLTVQEKKQMLEMLSEQDEDTDYSRLKKRTPSWSQAPIERKKEAENYLRDALSRGQAARYNLANFGSINGSLSGRFEPHIQCKIKEAGPNSYSVCKKLLSGQVRAETEHPNLVELQIKNCLKKDGIPFNPNDPKDLLDVASKQILKELERNESEPSHKEEQKTEEVVKEELDADSAIKMDGKKEQVEPTLEEKLESAKKIITKYISKCSPREYYLINELYDVSEAFSLLESRVRQKKDTKEIEEICNLINSIKDLFHNIADHENFLGALRRISEIEDTLS